VDLNEGTISHKPGPNRPGSGFLGTAMIQTVRKRNRWQHYPPQYIPVTKHTTSDLLIAHCGAVGNPCNLIRNNSSFRQKHHGVPDGSDGSDRTSYTLTEKCMLPVAQATGRVVYVLLYFVVTFTHHQKDTCVTLFAGAAVMLKPFTQRLAMLNHSY